MVHWLGNRPHSCVDQLLQLLVTRDQQLCIPVLAERMTALVREHRERAMRLTQERQTLLQQHGFHAAPAAARIVTHNGAAAEALITAAALADAAQNVSPLHAANRPRPGQQHTWACHAMTIQHLQPGHGAAPSFRSCCCTSQCLVNCHR